MIESLFDKYDVIVPKKRRYYIETNFSHYVHAHHAQPLIETRTVIDREYPEYLESFDQVMAKRGAHMFNMFIMKKEIFDQYAEWLFSILSYVEKRIDISSFSKQEARVYGYISELLLDVWLEQRHVKYKEVPWEQLGSKHLIKKSVGFLIRKFVRTDKNTSKTHF